MTALGKRWLAPLVVGGFGAVFLAAGWWLAGPAARDARAEAQALQALPVVDATSIGTLPAGTRVLAQGRLAPVPALPAHGLVLYERQQYEGTETTGASKRRQRWRPLERATPAFGLDVHGGVLAVASGDYGLEAPPREVSPQGGPVGGAVRLDLRVIDLSTQRLIGFAPGDAATIDGVIEAAPGGGRAVRAALVYGAGDVAAYRAARGGSAGIVRTVGIVFGSVGALGLAVAAFLLIRLGRHHGAPGADRGTA
jgi:hypothetical protein